MDRDREPDQELAAELRETAGREWVEEAAEDERLTEVHRRRGLSLEDQAKELVNRGDRVSVEFGGHSFSGSMAVAGADYAVVNGPGQVADIKLDAARWSVIPSDISGESGQTTDMTFKAVLDEHSASQKIVRLALPQSDMVIGKISTVAEDHVDVLDVDNRRLIVPMKMILAVVRSAENQ